MKRAVEEKNITVSCSEIFYYLFWSIMLCVKGIGLYEGMTLYNIGLVLAMVCLGISLLFTEFRVLELMWMFVLVLFGGWIYLNSGMQSALILVAVAIGLKNIKLSRIFKIGLLVFGSCFIYMVLRSLLGLGDLGPMLVHEKLGLGPILRWSLGYTHPNVLQITYVILSCFVLYVWNLAPGRKQLPLTVALMVGNIYIFIYSVSFTGFLFMTFMLVLNLYLQKRKRFSRLEKIGLFSLLPMCIVFSLLLPVVLDPDGRIFQIINKVLNNRFLASRIYLLDMRPSLFGKRVVNISNFAIDCSYTEAVMYYGIIFSVVLLGIYLLTIIDMIRKDARTELTIMLSLLVAGISEPFLFNASFKNITILFVGKYLYECTEMNAQKLDNAVLTCKVRFLSGLNRNINLSLNWMNELRYKLRKLFKRYLKVLVISAAIAFVGCGIICAKVAPQPESVYVGVKATDCGHLEEKYLDVESLPDDFDSVIYMYPGAEMPMYEFRGNILKVEYIRKILSASLWGSLGICGALIYVLTMQNIKRK